MAIWQLVEGLRPPQPWRAAPAVSCGGRGAGRHCGRRGQDSRCARGAVTTRDRFPACRRPTLCHDISASMLPSVPLRSCPPCLAPAWSLCAFVTVTGAAGRPPPPRYRRNWRQVLPVATWESGSALGGLLPRPGGHRSAGATSCPRPFGLICRQLFRDGHGLGGRPRTDPSVRPGGSGPRAGRGS